MYRLLRSQQHCTHTRLPLRHAHTRLPRAHRRLLMPEQPRRSMHWPKTTFRLVQHNLLQGKARRRTHARSRQYSLSQDSRKPFLRQPTLPHNSQDGARNRACWRRDSCLPPIWDLKTRLFVNTLTRGGGASRCGRSASSCRSGWYTNILV